MKISFSRAREKNLSNFSSRISRDRDSCQCLTGTPGIPGIPGVTGVTSVTRVTRVTSITRVTSVIQIAPKIYLPELLFFASLFFRRHNLLKVYFISVPNNQL